MKTRARAAQQLSVKLVACAVVVVLAAVGLLGLVLPVIPGLLFLAIAALILARQFPVVRAVLSRNPAIGKHMDRADRFFELPFARQLQVGGLLCLKVLLDGAAVVVAALAKLLGGTARPAR